jgi:integrase
MDWSPARTVGFQLPQIALLTSGQFRLLASHLREPFNTLALMCVCFGLRISEALGLKWADVDWLNATRRVERGIVQQIVDDVKTDDSRKTLTIANELFRRAEGVEAKGSILRPGGLDLRFTVSDW